MSKSPETSGGENSRPIRWAGQQVQQNDQAQPQQQDAPGSDDDIPF